MNSPEQIAVATNIQTEKKLYECVRYWGVNVNDDEGFCAAVTALKWPSALGRLNDASNLTIQDVAAEVFPNGR